MSLLQLYLPLEGTASKVNNASTLQLKIKIWVGVQNNLAYFSFMHCPLAANRKARWSDCLHWLVTVTFTKFFDLICHFLIIFYSFYVIVLWNECDMNRAKTTDKMKLSHKSTISLYLLRKCGSPFNVWKTIRGIIRISIKSKEYNYESGNVWRPPQLFATFSNYNKAYEFVFIYSTSYYLFKSTHLLNINCSFCSEVEIKLKQTSVPG